MNAAIKFFCYRILIFPLLLVTIGCSAKSPPPKEYSIQNKSAQFFQEQHKAILVPTAESAIGTPYKFGGIDGKGFDCSGFVRWVYSHAGVKLPRTAREQSKLGEAIKNQDDMQVGDIVAFYHKKRGYHTGIYVGDGKFVHSPRRRTKVRISDLSTSYFSNSFLSARRVVDNIKDSEIAAAKELLAEYQDQQVQAKVKSKIKTKKSKTKTVAKNKTKSKVVAKAKSKPKSKVATKSKAKTKPAASVAKSQNQPKAKVVAKAKITSKPKVKANSQPKSKSTSTAKTEKPSKSQSKSSPTKNLVSAN